MSRVQNAGGSSLTKKTMRIVLACGVARSDLPSAMHAATPEALSSAPGVL
jgi:cellobiose-specific phosphotransferase system component IIA